MVRGRDYISAFLSEGSSSSCTISIEGVHTHTYMFVHITLNSNLPHLLTLNRTTFSGRTPQRNMMTEGHLSLQVPL